MCSIKYGRVFKLIIFDDSVTAISGNFNENIKYAKELMLKKLIINVLDKTKETSLITMPTRKTILNDHAFSKMFYLKS